MLTRMYTDLVVPVERRRVVFLSLCLVPTNNGILCVSNAILVMAFNSNWPDHPRQR